MSIEKSSKAQDLNSGNIVKQLCEYLAKLWNSFIASLEPEPITFNEFLTETEKFLDEQILQTQSKEHFIYMGGKLILTLEDLSEGTDKDNFCINASAELYYNNSEKQWVQQAVTRKVRKNLFSDWDSSEELNNLRLNKKLEFDITPPETPENQEEKGE